MTRPDDIPQRVWDAAIKCAETVLRNLDQDDVKMEVELIARAILSAEQRERERIERLAMFGMNREGADPWAKGYRCASADIYEATRNRGTDND